MYNFPRDLEASINRQAGDIVKKAYQKTIFLKFDTIKSQMIAEFENHPVTAEIKEGPEAKNTSGTLNGYGNLFSYIGFEDGDDATSPVVELLKQTTLQFSKLTNEGPVWNIFMPAKNDVWDVTPMPWAVGRSWAKGIESGISGLGHYLYTQRKNLANSRSGTAVQSSSNIRSGMRFSNVKYITELLNKYEKKFSELNDSSIST